MKISVILYNRKFYCIFIIFFISNVIYSQKIDHNFWITNDNVTTITEDEEYIYVGGQFSHVGKNVGNGIMISIDTFFVYPRSKNQLSGIIYNSVIDDNGYIYFSGMYPDSIGNLSYGIKRINKFCELDSSFNFNFNDYSTISTNSNSNYLYTCSRSKSMNGFDYFNTNRINLKTLKLDTNWKVFENSKFTLIERDSNYLYMSINTSEIKFSNGPYELLKYDIDNNKFVENWKLKYNGYLSQLKILGDDIYIAGDFYVKRNNKNLPSRVSLLKINKSTGEADSNLIIFISKPDSPYNSMNRIAFDSKYIYLAGKFSEINNFQINNLCRISFDKFVIDTNFIFSNSGKEIFDIKVVDDNLIVAGDFEDFDNKNIDYLVKINTMSGKVDTNWNYKIDNIVKSISIQDKKLYISGEFSSYNSYNFNGLFRMNKNNFDIDLTWIPKIHLVNFQTISKMYVDDEFIYLGGFFTKINDKTVNYLARLFRETAELDTNWKPNSNGTIYDIKIDSENVYVSGQFNSLGETNIYSIAKLNKTNGNVDTIWKPISKINSVYNFCIDDIFVYYGNLKIDKNTGIKQVNTNLPVFDYYSDVLINDNKQYTTGIFYLDTSRKYSNYLLCLDEGGKIISNNLFKDLNSTGSTLLIDGNDLFIGFSNRYYDNRYLINSNKNTGEISKNWNFYFSGKKYDKQINSIYKTNDCLIVGGFFDWVNGKSRSYLLKLDIIKPKFSISGKITKNTIGVGNIEVSNGLFSEFTDDKGYYQFDSLLTSNYLVYPISYDYTHLPENYEILKLDSNINNINFELFNKVDKFRINNNLLYSNTIEGLQYILINLRGQIIKNEDLKFEEDFNNLPNGFYLLYILKGNAVIWSDKLLIVK